MKSCDVLFEWDRSVSTEIDRVEVSITVDGVTTKTTYPEEVQSFQMRIFAGSGGSFQVITYSPDGIPVMSEVHTFSIGTLELPQPATNLRHKIINVIDDTEPTPTPPEPTPTPPNPEEPINPLVMRAKPKHARR